MSTILEEIIAHKQTEVSSRKELYPAKLLERSIYFQTPVVSLSKYLLREDLIGIIAEIKRRSPSKGVINKYISVEELSIGYMQAGASALSVLTDEKYFGGTNRDLETARKFNFCPILRKEFIIDEYQLLEAKSIGADAILLIAHALESNKLKALARQARALGLEVLLEVHSKEELERSICEDINVVGVNNRNLDDFTVTIERSREIAAFIPSNFIKISESGIDSARAITDLKSAGFKGFLIGEAFMRTSDPAQACAELISAVKKEMGRP